MVKVTGKTARRWGGKLPPQARVYFVMALFVGEDYEEVWARLMETLADWDGFGRDHVMITDGAFSLVRLRSASGRGEPSGMSEMRSPAEATVSVASETHLLLAPSPLSGECTHATRVVASSTTRHPGR